MYNFIFNLTKGWIFLNIPPGNATAALKTYNFSACHTSVPGGF